MKKSQVDLDELIQDTREKIDMAAGRTVSRLHEILRLLEEANEQNQERAGEEGQERARRSRLKEKIDAAAGGAIERLQEILLLLEEVNEEQKRERAGKASAGPTEDQVEGEHYVEKDSGLGETAENSGSNNGGGT